MKHLTRKASTAALTLATVALPAAAIAHTGEGAHVHGGLMAGLTHPVTGMDHLVALVLFGALLAGTTLKEKQLGFAAAGISLAAGFAGGIALGGHVAMEALITGSALLFAAALAFPAQRARQGRLRRRLAAGRPRLGPRRGNDRQPGGLWRGLYGQLGTVDAGGPAAGPTDPENRPGPACRTGRRCRPGPDAAGGLIPTMSTAS